MFHFRVRVRFHYIYQKLSAYLLICQLLMKPSVFPERGGAIFMKMEMEMVGEEEEEEKYEFQIRRLQPQK